MTESLLDPREKEAADPRTPPERLRELFRASPDLAVALASNPASPSDLLERLAKTPHFGYIVRALAQHPNTPVALLLSLGEACPDLVLANPVFPLLTLEGPHLPAYYPPKLLAAVIASTEVTPSFLEWAVTEYRGDAQNNLVVFEAVARHPRTPTSRLEILGRRYPDSVRSRVALNPSAPPAVLAVLADDISATVREHAARNPATPAEALRRLIETHDVQVRGAAADNPALPASALDLLRRAGATQDLADFAPPDPDFDPAALEPLADRGPWALILMTRHPRATDAMLRVAARHADRLVQLAAGRSPALSEHLRLEFLASDLEYVRAGVAQAPHTPPALLTALACDPSGSVRYGLAANPATPFPVLQTMAQHADYYLRGLVASNAASAGELLASLAQDPITRVREGAMRNEAASALLLARGLTDRSRVVRHAAARHPAAPANVLEALRRAGVSDEMYPVGHIAPGASLTPEHRATLLALGAFARRIVARFPDTPADVLAVLATDPDPYTRAHVAAHARTPAEARTRLAHEASTTVRLAIAGSAFASEHALLPLARDAALSVRRRLAETRTTPPTVLAILAEDHDPLVRQAVARHANVPADRVARLVWAGSRPDLAARVPNVTPQRARDAAERALLAALASGGPFACELAAHHPDTAPEALDALSRATDPALRLAVITNPGTSRAALHRLAMDMIGQVRIAARRRLRAIGASAATADAAGTPPQPFALLAIARAPDAAPETLAALARHEHQHVRQAVAAHPRCPPEVLAVLAQDPSPVVQRVVARRDQRLKKRLARLHGHTEGAPLAPPDEPPSRL